MATPNEVKVSTPDYEALAKGVAGGARKLSDVTSTLTKNATSILDAEVNTALVDALGKCAKHLYSVHGQLERAAWAVMRAGSIFPMFDRNLGLMINNPYATRAPTHPWQPGQLYGTFPLNPSLVPKTEPTP